MNSQIGQLTSDSILTTASAPMVESSSVTVGDIFRSLATHKWLIAACILVCLIFAAIYTKLTTPMYEASASIRIDPSRAGSLGLSDLLSMASGGGSGDPVQTEMSILTSDGVALAALNSLSDQEFYAYAGFDKHVMNFAPSDQPLTNKQENLLASFKLHLAAKQIEGTQIIGLHFRDANPQVASTITNHLITAYIRQNFDSRYSSVSQATVWLSAQMEQLKEHAASAQKKLADFQEANNLLGSDASNNTTMDRIKLLNERLTLAEGDRIVKEAQMRAAESGDPAVLTSLFPDPGLQSLQTEEAALFAQYAQLSTRFGPAYQPLNDLKLQMIKIKTKIRENVGVISGRLQEDYGASSRAESMLRSEYAREMDKAYELNRKQADYAVLVADGTSSRELYDMLQYKLQQAVVDAGLNSVNTMIVDRARPPLTPVEPKKMLILVFGFVLGLAIGVGSALLRESMSDQIHGISQLESRSGFATLATIPRAETPKGNQAQQKDSYYLTTLTNPRSRQAEAYRSLRNSVLLSSIDKPPKVILITSSLPSEGKSSLSANYAIVLAQKGSRVLLVDADLRRPTLHQYFGVSKKIGLSDKLIENQEQPEFIMPTADLPNLYFLPAGMNITFPSEALGSAKFRNLVEAWNQEFDYIIIDSAPLLTVSDSLPIASWADTVILVVRYGITPMKALLRTKAILARAHASVAGVVLNDTSKIDVDSGYYGRDGYEYYS